MCLKGISALSNPADQIDSTSLADEAERMLAALADQYLTWLEKDLERYSEALETIKAHPEDQAESVQQIFSISHNIKGQGAAFGYQFVTDVAELAANKTRNEKTAPPDVLALLELCLGALKLVVEEDIRGDGGPTGQEILLRLQALSVAA